MVNKEKIKYKILSCKNFNKQNLAANGILFGRINTFKQSRIELIANRNAHREI